MDGIGKILFPVDLSPASPKLVPYVTMMAEKFGSEIHLLFVVRELRHLSEMYIPGSEIHALEQGVSEGARRRLDVFRSEYFYLPGTMEVPPVDVGSAGIADSLAEEKELAAFKDRNFPLPERIKTAVMSGDPAEEILNYTQNNEIDLIIMGTHGRKGLNRIVFGSVAERVVKNSPVPVFIANPYKSSTH